MDLVALVKDAVEPLFHATMEVPVLALPLLFFGGLLVGWFLGH